MWRPMAAATSHRGAIAALDEPSSAMFVSGFRGLGPWPGCGVTDCGRNRPRVHWQRSGLVDTPSARPIRLTQWLDHWQRSGLVDTPFKRFLARPASHPHTRAAPAAHRRRQAKHRAGAAGGPVTGTSPPAATESTERGAPAALARTGPPRRP